MRSMLLIIFYSFLPSLIYAAHDHITVVDFDISMNISPYYQTCLPEQNMAWRYAKKSFETHIAQHQIFMVKPRIPKIIHQIWVGPHPFPEHCKAFQKTWKLHHPDWIYILWTNDLVEDFGLKNKAQYDATQNYGEKADIARYEILDKFGGLYIDTDFECLKPFDPLNHCCDFYAGISPESTLEVYNGLIGTIPGHPIIKYCIEAISTHTTENLSYDTLDIIKRTGPIFFTQQIMKYLPNSTTNTVLFPLTYFYPWPNGVRLENKRSDIERWFKPESFAVHHWHMSWVQQ